MVPCPQGVYRPVREEADRGTGIAPGVPWVEMASLPSEVGEQVSRRLLRGRLTQGPYRPPTRGRGWGQQQEQNPKPLKSGSKGDETWASVLNQVPCASP